MADIFFDITPITLDRASPRQTTEKSGTGERTSSKVKAEGDEPNADIESLMRQIDEFQLQSDLDLVATLQAQKSFVRTKLQNYGARQKEIDTLLYEALQMAKTLKDAVNTYYRRQKVAEADWLACWDVGDSEHQDDKIITTWI